MLYIFTITLMELFSHINLYSMQCPTILYFLCVQGLFILPILHSQTGWVTLLKIVTFNL